MTTPADLAWRVYTELRKEIVATQQLRSGIVGLKITIVSAALGYIIANVEREDWAVLVIPAFAAIFFDFLINASSLAINRKGAYCATVLEPKMHAEAGWPEKDQLWEQHVGRMSRRQLMPLTANLGMTLLSSIPAVLVLVRDQPPFWRALIATLAVGLLAVLWTHMWVGVAVKRRSGISWRDAFLRLLGLDTKDETPPKD